MRSMRLFDKWDIEEDEIVLFIQQENDSSSLQRNNSLLANCVNSIQMMKQFFSIIQKDLLKPRTDLHILVVGRIDKLQVTQHRAKLT